MRVLGIALLICLATTACGVASEVAGETNARPAQAAAPAGFTADAGAAENGQLELAMGSTVERVRRQYADRLAGLYYEADQQRIVVRLTGPEPVATETHAVGDATLRVEFQPGAGHTFAELYEVMESSADKIAAEVPTAHSRYVDERTGEIVIAVSPGTTAIEAQSARLAQALGVPVRLVGEEGAVQQQPALR